MKFGLKDEVIDKINNVFAAYPHIEKGVIYGSRAKGNYKNGSDIDLTLLGDSLSSQDMSHIRSDIDNLLTPYSFDLSIFKEIDNDNLKEHISRVGKVFYQKKQK